MSSTDGGDGSWQVGNAVSCPLASSGRRTGILSPGRHSWPDSFVLGCFVSASTGALHAGKLADLAAFTPDRGYGTLGDEETECVLTMVGGEILHS